MAYWYPGAAEQFDIGANFLSKKRGNRMDIFILNVILGLIAGGALWLASRDTKPRDNGEVE